MTDMTPEPENTETGPLLLKSHKSQNSDHGFLPWGEQLECVHSGTIPFPVFRFWEQVELVDPGTIPLPVFRSGIGLQHVYRILPKRRMATDAGIAILIRGIDRTLLDFLHPASTLQPEPFFSGIHSPTQSYA